MSEKDHKYEVEVIRLSRAQRVPRELREELEKMFSKKVISKFSKDAVDCPVRGKRVSFLFCLACRNYVRRFKGFVHCRGLPLDEDS